MKKTWKDEENNEFAKLWKAGVNHKILAAKFGCSESTLRKQRQKLGLKPRNTRFVQQFPAHCCIRVKMSQELFDKTKQHAIKTETPTPVLIRQFLERETSNEL